MKTNEIAKNLLQNKTCDNCKRKSVITRSNNCIVPRKNMDQTDILFTPRSENNTCDDWKGEWTKTNSTNFLK